MKRLIILAFFLPTFAFGKDFTTPSGLTVSVSDSEVSYIEQAGGSFVLKPFALPSGIIIWAESLVSVPHAQADELTLTEQIKLYIIGISQNKGLDPTRVLEIAYCESNGFDPKALNPKDTDGRPKFGLFQFDKNTFLGKDIWDWKEQTNQATDLMAKGLWNKWPWCNAHRENYKYKIAS